MGGIIVEPVEQEFYINGEDEDPIVVKQVKVVSLHGEVFLDPDQAINLINDLEFALKEINGE